MATWLAGAIPAPIDPRTRAADLPYFLGDIAPVLIVSTDEHAERLAAASDAHVIGFDAPTLSDGGPRTATAPRRRCSGPTPPARRGRPRRACSSRGR